MRYAFSLVLLCFMSACVASPAHRPKVDYPALKVRMVELRDSLGKAYAGARTDETRTAILGKARTALLKAVEKEIIPAWYGTPWDFNGVTQVPGEGKIACGYFVTTVLRDAGVVLERARMAQQPSLYIIRSLTPRETIKDYSGITSAQFADRVKGLPQGLYVVGLDIHTGFVLHTAKGVDFIHASYGDPAEVVRESAYASNVLSQSKRFVLGRVDNDWLLRKWVTAEKCETFTGG